MVAQQTPRATRGSHLYQSSATQQHQSFKQSALGGQPSGSGKSERNQSMKQGGSASAEQHQQNSRKVTLAKQAQIHDNVKAGGAHSQLGLQREHTMQGTAAKGIQVTHKEALATLQASTGNIAQQMLTQQQLQKQNTLSEYRQYMEKQKQMLRQLSSNKLSQVLHTINNATPGMTIEHEMADDADSCAAANCGDSNPRQSYAATMTSN